MKAIAHGSAAAMPDLAATDEPLLLYEPHRSFRHHAIYLTATECLARKGMDRSTSNSCA
jgi:hypothetical protein